MTEPVTDFDITDAMIAIGGAFVGRLGLLYRVADRENQARLKAAFPELWTKYEDVVRLHRVRHDAEVR